MPMYRIHLEWDDEYSDLERAKEDGRQMWEAIESLSGEDDPTTLQVFDVQVVPQKRLYDQARDEEEFEPVEPGNSDDDPIGIGAGDAVLGGKHGTSFYPPDGPPHPWEQGLNIFPPDHPYRVFEDMVRQGDTGPGDQEEARQDYWEQKLKELNAGE